MFDLLGFFSSMATTYVYSPNYTRLDSWHKGYERGTRDIELKCKLGEYTDVVAIELKNPDKSNKLSDDQKKYVEKLEKNMLKHSSVMITTILSIGSEITTKSLVI
ncbi:MAG: hypothetical protein ACKPKO_61140, partial [Candidatus Fonsibacter sp.]